MSIFWKRSDKFSKELLQPFEQNNLENWIDVQAQVFISISQNLAIIFTSVFRVIKQRLPKSNHILNTPGVHQ